MSKADGFKLDGVENKWDIGEGTGNAKDWEEESELCNEKAIRIL